MLEQVVQHQICISHAPRRCRGRCGKVWSRDRSTNRLNIVRVFEQHREHLISLEASTPSCEEGDSVVALLRLVEESANDQIFALMKIEIFCL